MDGFLQEEGVKSKRQMKIMLRWLRARRDLQVTCHHLTGEKGSSSGKEFLFAIAAKKPAEKNSSLAELGRNCKTVDK